MPSRPAGLQSGWEGALREEQRPDKVYYGFMQRLKPFTGVNNSTNTKNNLLIRDFQDAFKDLLFSLQVLVYRPLPAPDFNLRVKNNRAGSFLMCSEIGELFLFEDVQRSCKTELPLAVIYNISCP